MSCLLLSFCHFFNEDPGRCSPACMRVCELVASGTFSDPESHSHLSLVNVIAVTFNVTVTVEIVTNSLSHVECSGNGTRRAALGAIEFEKPTATAAIAVVNPEVTSKVDMEGSVSVVLREFTILYCMKITVIN